MKTKTIKGQKFIEYPNGVLVPAILVRDQPVKIRTPKDILPFLESEKFALQETVILFTLDGNNQIIKKHIVTIGTANQSQIHPREIFVLAITDRAVTIMLSHNHPSGNLLESEADLVATKRISESGKLLGIPLLDHVIISSNGFKSLRESHHHYFN